MAASEELVPKKAPSPHQFDFVTSDLKQKKILSKKFVKRLLQLKAADQPIYFSLSNRCMN